MLMMLFMIPLCFLNKSFWLIQLIFFMSFIFMFNGSFNYLWMNLSYMFGSDMLSFGLILLSFWICSLMILASESIYKKKFFYQFFLFFLLILLLFLYLTFSSMNLFMFFFNVVLFLRWF